MEKASFVITLSSHSCHDADCLLFSVAAVADAVGESVLGKDGEQQGGENHKREGIHDKLALAAVWIVVIR